jgi:tetratricopeptide (TPR) repeat protein
MSRVRRFAFGLLVSAFGTVASPAFAVGEGRIHGTITGEDGRPLSGVAILVTTPERTNFELEETTDAKGAYALTIRDASLVYTYRFSKPGYQTLEHVEKIPMHTNSKRDFTLKTERAVGAATGVFNEGAVAAQAKDYTTAEAKFKEAVALDPALAAGWSALAAIYLEQGKSADAAAMADKAVELAPEVARHQHLRYEAWRLAGNAEKAAEAKAAFESLDPKGMVIPLVNQGIEAFNQGDIAAATKALEQAIALDDTNIKGLFTLGLCYVNANDPEKAKATFQRYLDLAPADDPDMATAKEMVSYL